MPTTSHGAPYPSPGDVPDVPAFIYALAQWTGDKIDEIAQNLFNNVPADLLELGQWTSDQIASVRSDLDAAVPVGTVIEWDAPPTATLPAKYLEQNGQAVSRSTYAKLFALYGTYYGAGDGSTTFNLPDRKGRVPVGHHPPAGSDPGQTEFDTIGEKGGAKTHTLTVAEMPGHSHGGVTGYDSPDHTHGFIQESGVASTTNTGGAPGSLIGGTYQPQTSGASARHSHSIGSQGGGQAHNNLQPYIVTRFLVKAL